MDFFYKYWSVPYEIYGVFFFFAFYSKQKQTSVSQATVREILFLSVSNMRDLEAFISLCNRQKKNNILTCYRLISLEYFYTYEP